MNRAETCKCPPRQEADPPAEAARKRKGIRRKIENQRFGEERALYHLADALVSSCRFEGAEDGESALKEGRRLQVEKCFFDLRYPLWHVDGLALLKSEMTQGCRAALWYGRDLELKDCALHGIKAVRECRGVNIYDSFVRSPEFGWNSSRVYINNTQVESEYAFLNGKNIVAKNLDFSGKYSFQYVRGLKISNSRLRTKDAFWHAQNVVVSDSVVEGEYLGWYSKNVTFVRCHIKGTQPLCYCKKLRLIDCTTEDADLAFEYSDVKASLRGEILSVKNPRRGRIEADGFGEVVLENSVCPSRAKLIARKP